MKEEKRLLKQRSHENRRTSSSSSNVGGGQSAAAASNLPYIDQSPVKVAVEELQQTEHVSGRTLNNILVERTTRRECLSVAHKFKFSAYDIDARPSRLASPSATDGLTDRRCK